MASDGTQTFESSFRAVWIAVAIQTARNSQRMRESVQE